LKKKGEPFDEDIKLGIMVEVPSAAMMAESLARKADFLSIGTNDLTQYTLASDRMNIRVSNVYSAFHPSVLRLIRMTIEAGKKSGIPVSICGEIAGDLLALPLFIGLDVDLLSMSPSRIFDLYRLVRKIDASMARHLALSVMESTTQQSVLNKLQSYKQELEKKPFRKRK
jgi:phosphotransferase system enzyme I (PtsI)